jgi:drug/metabolite transporter (DMT)-like permease
MDDMRELVSIEAVERLFVWLAVAGPVAGVFAGVLLGLRRRRVGPYAVRGMLFGLLGTVNWALWKMYSALTEHFGLDSVQNLLINLGIFLTLGLCAGVIYGLVSRKHAGASSGAAATAGGRDGQEDTGG